MASHTTEDSLLLVTILTMEVIPLSVNRKIQTQTYFHRQKISAQDKVCFLFFQPSPITILISLLVNFTQNHPPIKIRLFSYFSCQDKR